MCADHTCYHTQQGPTDMDYRKEDNQIICYVNDALRMIYPDKMNKKKIFGWWLKKFEYLANVFEVPDCKKAELFLEMVNKNMHEQIEKEYPNVNFTESTYVEIISHYISYFNYSHEIISHRELCKYIDQYEQRATLKCATISQQYVCPSKNELIIKIGDIFLSRYNDIKLTKYLQPTSLYSVLEIAILVRSYASKIVLAHYIYAEVSMINIYKPENEMKFCEWLNKFEYVADILMLQNDEKLKFFNDMVHTDVHKGVKEKFSSANFSKLSYDNKINYYLRYFDPNNESNLYRNCFTCRMQYKNETLENYIINLRKLYDKCSYTSAFDEILCEQFNKGIRDDEIRTIVNNVRGLSFDQTKKFAIELTKFKRKAIVLQPTVSRIHTYSLENGGVFYDWLNRFMYLTNVINIPCHQIIDFFKNMVDKQVHAYVEKCYPNVNLFSLLYFTIIEHYFSCLSLSPVSSSYKRCFVYRKQYEQETIKSFAENLRDLIDQSDYIDPKDERICDQFRYGINDDSIKNYVDRYLEVSFHVMVAIANEYSNELHFMEDD